MMMDIVNGRPEGYETVEEVAIRWGIQPGTVRVYSHLGLIPTLKIGNRLFFREGVSKPSRRRRRA